MNDHIKSEIPSYLAGELPESRNRQIEAHTAACEKCRNALSKARAKQARHKRDALKKASADRVPNFFLARQGKAVDNEAPSSKKSFTIILSVVLIGAGYWFYRHYGNPAHVVVASATPVSPEATKAPPPPPPPPPMAAQAPAAPAPEKQSNVPAAPLVLPVLQSWKGPECGIVVSRLVVIRNDEAWKKLWTEMNVSDPLPDVDFDSKVVVGVFAGAQPIGTSILLGKLEGMDDIVYAPYHIAVSASASAGAPAVQTTSGTAAAVPTTVHPYLLALVPRVNKKIRLTEKEDLR